MSPFSPTFLAASASSPTTRRHALRTLAAFSASTFLPNFTQANEPEEWQKPLVAYLESLAKADGGYGWPDQPHSHLTPTHAVIGTYDGMKLAPPNRDRLAEFVRNHHPAKLKKLEQERRVFDFQQVQALHWLGANTSELREKIRPWNKPNTYLRQYERHGYPLFQSEASVFTSRALLGLPMDELSPAFTAYLDSRRRPNGSFNNTPAADGSDGHIMNTWWGLQALHALGRSAESRDETVAWLRSCQLHGGGFTYQPKPEFAGVDGVDYTWAAVRALHLLGAEPADRAGCIAYLVSLANSDGGFGDRPGHLSNPVATYRAIDALLLLGEIQLPEPARRRTVPAIPAPPDDYQVFTIQIEAHGCGSPTEAVDLARALRIHLWGAKNAPEGWIARAQSIADTQRVPVTFFVSNEEYDTWVDIPGLGTYSHTSDIIGPAGADLG